ncbi:hypothetical protein LguiA_021553 [Lonicera macranthoides]
MGGGANSSKLSKSALPLLLEPLELSLSGFSCNWRANSRFHNTSPIEGRSIPWSDKHLMAVSANFFKHSGFILPFNWGSMISSSVPFL